MKLSKMLAWGVGVMAALAVVVGMEGPLTAQDKQPGEDTVVVKPLKLTKPSFKLGGKGEVKVFGKAEDLEKFAGKAVADQLMGQVDWAKEEVAFVSWQSGGPPYGELKHEVKGKERQVTFYVQEPKVGPNEPRGTALRLGADFFAVTKGASVKFGGLRKG